MDPFLGPIVFQTTVNVHEGCILIKMDGIVMGLVDVKDSSMRKSMDSCVVGGLIIDRWFTLIDLMITVNAVMLTASGVWSAYNA